MDFSNRLYDRAISANYVKQGESNRIIKQLSHLLALPYKMYKKSLKIDLSVLQKQELALNIHLFSG